MPMAPRNDHGALDRERYERGSPSRDNTPDPRDWASQAPVSDYRREAMAQHSDLRQEYAAASSPPLPGYGGKSGENREHLDVLFDTSYGERYNEWVQTQVRNAVTVAEADTRKVCEAERENERLVAFGHIKGIEEELEERARLWAEEKVHVHVHVHLELD